MSLQSRFKSLGVLYQTSNSEDFSKEFNYKVTKGMGTTLGNSIRRTLFSQIPGYAIRYVSITGLNHEFSTISGVKESAQELIMNLRKIIFKGESKSTKAILNITKSGEIFASDIKGMTLSIINEDLYLCTMEESATLRVEIYIEKGVGIILSRDVNANDFEMDAIVCDSFFNPVEKVNFEVSSIENNLTEESLSLTITTNGSVSPDEVMDFAIDIWRHEMAKISEKMIVPVMEDAVQSKQLRILSDTLYYKVSDIQGITTRILNCIKSLNVKYVGELVRYSQKELLEKPNFGENSLNQLVEMLGNMGLTLGMDTTGWERPEEEISEDIFIR